MSVDKISCYEKLPDDPLLGPLYAAGAEQPSELLHHQFGKSLRQDVESRALKAERKLKWIVPFTLLMGMALGAVGTAWVVNNAQKIQQQMEASNLTGVIDLVTENNNVAKGVRKDPQLWISYIAELLHDEKLLLVEQELAAFKESFPNYQQLK